jgi:hypothetical protein
LGTVFGFIALSQIKRTGQGGRGFAIAGIIISAVVFVVTALILILAAVTSTPSKEHSDHSSGPAVVITVEPHALSPTVTA